METSTKKPKRATGCICLFWFYLKNKKEQREEQKRQLTTNANTYQKPKRATKSIFHSHFHSFTPILDPWKMVDIKNNGKSERATTGNSDFYVSIIGFIWQSTSMSLKQFIMNSSVSCCSQQTMHITLENRLCVCLHASIV